MEDPGWIYRYVFESGAPTLVLDAADMTVLAANLPMASLADRSLEAMVGGPADFIVSPKREQGLDWRRHRSVEIIKQDESTVAAEMTVLCMERVPKPAVILRVDPLDHSTTDRPDKLQTKHAALQRAHRELQAAYNRHELLIDELNHRNKELQEVYQRLSYAAKMATIGELSAGMAHGINNPLAAAVSANRQAAALVEGMGEDSQEALTPLHERIDRALQRIEFIVKDLRRLATAGSRQHDLECVDMKEEIQATLELISHRFEQVKPELDLTPCLICRVAPDDFSQVILVLIDNAVHALGGSGHLAVRLKRESGQAVIEVEDGAGGIPEEIQDKIFDPFFTTKDPSRGTGIGLCVARGIIEGYAGSITASSRPGEGTTFRIALPLEETP